jgi:hypothetical protein
MGETTAATSRGRKPLIQNNLARTSATRFNANRSKCGAKPPQEESRKLISKGPLFILDQRRQHHSPPSASDGSEGISFATCAPAYLTIK